MCGVTGTCERADIILLERINPVDNQVIMKMELWARLITATPQGLLWNCLELSTMVFSLSKGLGRLLRGNLCKAKDGPALPSHQLAVDRLASTNDIRCAVLAMWGQTNYQLHDLWNFAKYLIFHARELNPRLLNSRTNASRCSRDAQSISRDAQ